MITKSKQLRSKIFSWIAMFVVAGGLVVPALASFQTAHAASASVDLLPRGTTVTFSSLQKETDLPLVTCSVVYLDDGGQGKTKESSENFKTWIPQGDKVLDYMRSHSQPQAGYSSPLGDLTNQEWDYVAGNFNKTIPVLTFKAVADGAHRDTNGLCAKLYLVPVSETKWVGYQIEGINQGSVPPPTSVSFKLTKAGEGELNYYTRQGSGPTSKGIKTTTTVALTGTPPQDAPPAGGGNKVINATWVDAANIKIGDEVFTKRVWDEKPYYFLSSSPNSARQTDSSAKKDDQPMATGNTTGRSKNCVPFLYSPDAQFNLSKSYLPNSLNKLQERIDSLSAKSFQYYDYDSATCAELDPFGLPVTFTNVGSAASKTWFYYSKAEDKYISVFLDGGSNERPYVNGAVYEKPASTNFYAGGTICKDNRITRTVDPVPGSATPVTWQLKSNGSGNDSCQTIYTPSLTMFSLSDDSKFNTAVNAYKNTVAATDDGADSPSCDTSLSSPITWFTCPLYNAALTAVQQFDKIITSQLVLPVSAYFGVDGCADNKPQSDPTKKDDCAAARGVRTAWSGMRNLALGGLVIVGLVMVISQAFSVGPFDSYTIKKLLPRLIIAVIAISLSWQLMEVAIRISNVAGLGVRALIEAPFSSLGGGEINGSIKGGILLFEGAGVLALGSIGLLSFALTAFLAVMIAFGTLVFRQILVMALVIVAPIAILCSILPGTRKAWEFWEDSFKGVLLVFPIITGFIAIGHAFSAVAMNMDSTGNSLFVQAIAIIAYFLPYFFLPAAFKVASGIFSTITGSLNDRSKGAFDRLNKLRSNQVAQRTGKMKTGSLYHGRNPVARRFNRISQGIATGQKGHFGLGARGRAAVDLSSRLSQSEAQKNTKLQQLAFNDDGIMALALSAGDAKKGEERLRQAQPKWSDSKIHEAMEAARAVGINRENSLAALDLMAKNKSFSLPSTEEGMKTVLETADDFAGVKRDSNGKVISGNGALAANIMGGFEYASRSAGRFDLGNHDYTAWKPSLDSAWGKASIQQHAQASGDSTKAFGEHFVKLLSSADPNERSRGAISLLEMKNALPGATGGNQKLINDVLEKAGLDFNLTKKIAVRDPVSGAVTTTDVPMSIEEQLVDKAGSITIQDLRAKARVYDTQVPYDARGGGGAPAAPTPPTGSP